MEDTVNDVTECGKVEDTILYGRHVELIPFKDPADWEYLFDLAETDEGHYATREQLIDTIKRYGFRFWIMEAKGVRWGVGLCLKADDKFIMEGLKDKRVSGVTIKHSVEAGQLVLKYLSGLTDTVLTCAREKDKGIQILCRKLGFVQTETVASPYGKIVLFKKEDKKCQSLQQ